MQYLKFYFSAAARALIGGGGGGVYSYIRVLPDLFLLNVNLKTTDYKISQSGRTRIYEYTPPPPPINALVTALLNEAERQHGDNGCLHNEIHDIVQKG